MANNPAVRKVLSRAVSDSRDTLLRAQHDTTRNDVRIVDLEDVPCDTRKDWCGCWTIFERRVSRRRTNGGLALRGRLPVEAQGLT